MPTFSAAKNKDHSPKLSKTLEELCERPSFLINLDDFLNEKDPIKALKYWLKTHTDSSKITSLESLSAAIDRHINDLDYLINDQINAIIHHPRFQQIESSWRGLWHLAVQADGVKSLKIKVLDISWKEISRDIDRALEFDQSQLFIKVYNDEYGSPGGEPYGVLIGDYEISHRTSREHPNDIATLKGLSEISAAAFTPFIASASCEFFGIESFEELSSPLDLENSFKQDQFIKWRALRESSDSRFLGLTLPKILMRKPYRKKPGNYKGIFFFERLDNKSAKNYLWGNAAYAFATILIREFASVGWFGHIRGVPRNEIGGGLITNLPVDSFETDNYDLASKPSTDVVITDKTEKELSHLGFIPLSQCYDTEFTAFFSNQSIQKPQIKQGFDQDSMTNARISAMLQHVLCGARIAHYIKVMIRDKVGSFIGPKDCEEVLRKWLFKYTSGRQDLGWAEQARYPIRESKVHVKEHPEKPGQFICTIHLVPHYQLDQMVSELELVTELVQSK